MTVKSGIALDEYDKATLAATGIACAARLLLDASPSEHITAMGHETRDFLLASILENAAVVRRQLDIALGKEAAR